MARVVDIRSGLGRPVADIIQPTLTIPHECMCSWIVVRAGPGFACLSKIKYTNSLCSVRHDPAASSNLAGRMGGGAV